MSKNSTSVGLRVISRKASTPVCADTISGVDPVFFENGQQAFFKDLRECGIVIAQYNAHACSSLLCSELTIP